MRRPGVPLISHSALSRYVGAALLLGHQSSCDCHSTHKDEGGTERQGVAAIWFEVVNSHKQKGGNDADAEDVNETSIRTFRGYCDHCAGTRIAPRPPHRSRRALLTHRAYMRTRLSRGSFAGV